MTRYDPAVHHRRSIRLPDYDYSREGAYDVTIVTWGREFLFGEVVNGEMRLNRYGEIVDCAWHDLSDHYPYVELDAFCIMPNHVHGIIVLVDDQAVGAGVGAGLRPAPTGIIRVRHPLSEIVRAFKSFSARRINSSRGTRGTPVWQRGYYEHILRNNGDYLATCGYILDNPTDWEKDDENPGAKR